MAEVPLNYARMTVRDLVQQAYDAGRTRGVEGEQTAKPTAEEVNKAIQTIERGAVVLAHARMEHVAKACGFEGLTEALGYLQTLRANPIAELLREAVNLAAIGDIHPSDDPAEAGGWGNWMKRARAVVGDAAPPAEVAPNDEALADLEHARREAMPEVLSGCAVRAAIQRDEGGYECITHGPYCNGNSKNCELVHAAPQTGDAAADPEPTSETTYGGVPTSKH